MSNVSSQPKGLDDLLKSASGRVSENDIAAAQASSEQMKQHSESLDMLQFRMFAADENHK